jgi:hypothetical protein
MMRVLSCCALAALVACNAVFGIERHDSADSGGSGGAAIGGAATGGAAAGGGTGGLVDETAAQGGFLALWSFEAMADNQVLASGGVVLPLKVEGGTLAEGPTGNYLQLTTPQSSATASAPVVDSSRSFSISVWVRLDQLDTWETFVSQDGQNVSSFYLQKRDTGQFAFTTFPTDSTSAAPCVAWAALRPRVGEWYHLVATRDSTTGEQRVYVDGVLSGKVNCTGSFRATGPLVVGRGKWGTPADWAAGALDELGVSNRVLSPSEIVNLYLQGRPDARHYFFAYFQEGSDGSGDGLRLAHSHDALHWGALGAEKVFLPATVGGRSFRDPHVMRDPFGTYHVVWTTSCVPWGRPNCVQDHGFGHATSKDLVSFSAPAFIEISRDKLNVEHFWAPETFYDAASEQYLLSWASPPDLSDGPDPHGIYYMVTKDFLTFSDPALLYAREGRDFIDATILQNGNAYLLFLKDEAEGQKNLRVITSPVLFGSSAWAGEVSAPLTGAFAAEAPAPLLQDGRLLLFFDKYADKVYGALHSRDLAQLTDPSVWEDATGSVSAVGLRHGSPIEVPSEVFRAVALRAGE